MSQRPTSLSPDLGRLIDDGYDVEIVGGYLVLRDVPYVDRHRRVRRGSLVSRLDLAGDRTVPPRDHQAWFAGALPCDADGQPLLAMVHAHHERDLGSGLLVDHWLCSRPLGREFRDYHEKMTTFVAQIASPAVALDPTVAAQPGRVVETDSGESPFNYVDTATSRNGIGALADRLADQSVGIIGLGGTGSYVLDLVAKTPVRRIHLFDDDEFLQHNAFRAPGAPSVADLVERRSKVEHLDRIYSRMHRGIVPHRVRVGPKTHHMLDHLDFAFVCMDGTDGKKALVRRLEESRTPFVDVGMGLQATENGLVGTLRVTTSDDGMRSHVWDRQRIPFGGDDQADAYATNIQVADLNALNAALAVIRWKRLRGFYADLEHEHVSAYSLDGNCILNEDRPPPPTAEAD